MAKAKAQQQMMYPGLYQRTNNTANSRNNVQNLQQQQQVLFYIYIFHSQCKMGSEESKWIDQLVVKQSWAGVRFGNK